MKITKFGHCCLLIEERELRILTDPGNFTTEQNNITDIDVILITHEHADHFHVPSVLELVKNNPEAKIITNSAVAILLEAQGISTSIIVEDCQSHQVEEVVFRGFGKKHAIIYKELGQVENTGYFIGPRLFYPGDAFYNPNKPVEVLALPVAGPWVKVSEVYDYALEVGAKVCFPVHDGNVKFLNNIYQAPSMKVLQEAGITFVPLELGKETEF